MRILLFFFSILPLLWAEEPSAFGAGDLNAQNPYGLTNTEKFIHQNKQSIERLSEQQYKIQNDLSRLQQSFDGLKSVIEGELAKQRSKVMKLQDLPERLSQTEDTLSAVRQDQNATFVSIKETVEKNNQIQNDNVQNLKHALDKLSALIDKINSGYVTQKSFDSFKNEIIDILKESTKKSDPKLSGKENAAQYEQALEEFQSGNYAAAKTRFESSLENHYKPASSTFHLGEIAFHDKRYDEALYYYKKSVSLYDKADYMPTLLYHSALSFEKTGDQANAVKFFQNVIASYPDSPEAKEATSKLPKK